MITMITEDSISALWQALRFAADKHRTQRRKDEEASAYINHPLQVATTLWEVGKVRDMVIIIGGLLHDTMEDTQTTPTEIETLFGAEVLAVVQEVTDDKSLPKSQRKQLQIQNAPHQSWRAKHIKLADKICNLDDLLHHPPHTWPRQQRWEYIDWTEQVVVGLRGTNPALEAHYDTLLTTAKLKYNTTTD